MKDSPPPNLEVNTSENNSLNARVNYSYKLPIEQIVFVICIFTSLAVLVSWFLGYEKILSIIPGSATMKFNTALVFLLAGLNLMLSQKKDEAYKTISKILAISSILIGFISLISYFGINFLKIDNLFVLDTYSTEKPGMMSPATASCSILIGLGFLGLKSESRFFKSIAQASNIIVGVISLLAILAFVLLIPSEHKTSLFQTMAIHTSFLFFIISIILMLKNPKSLLNTMIIGKHSGSVIFRQVLPKVIFFPIILSNLLLVGINQELINIDFGIVTFTVLLIIMSIAYISYLAYGLNINEKIRYDLESDLLKTNKKLKKIKNSLDKAAILVMADKDGIIKYVNDAFCKISKYSNTELIGNHYNIINSGYLSDSQKKNMWDTINSGKIWSGNKKNKAKDGSFYWVNTNIIPFKNDDGIVTEFLSIKQDITNTKRKKS